MRAVIFANGRLSQPLHLLPDDYLIAANGGTHHCLSLGLLPHVVIGDLDSLGAHHVEHLRAAGVTFLEYPARKDYTDLELALGYAQTLGVERILIVAALGERWDQTLANVLLPAAQQGPPVSLVDDRQEIHYLRGPSELRLEGRPGDTLSLIPLTGAAEGIHTEGLEYPLHDETLLFGSTRGVSNVFLAEQARVTLRSGLLACVVIHHG